MRKTEYFVEGIWPKRRLNLIAGASGAGKTRWIVPQLLNLIHGKSVLGAPTTPTRCAYVACDRTSEDALATFNSMGLDIATLSVRSFMDCDDEWNLTNMFKMVKQGTELVFIEAIAALVPRGNIIDYTTILNFGRQINRAMRVTGISIWGSTHCPKIKRGEEYLRTRDNVIGSAAWAGICGTIAYVAEEKDGTREVTVMPRDEPVRHLSYEFDACGNLTELTREPCRPFMDAQLTGIETGFEVPVSVLLEWARHAKMSRASLFRWIDEKIEAGELTKVGHGLYSKRGKQ